MLGKLNSSEISLSGMIRFEDVSKTYSGGNNALSNISVEIPDGAFVFLIGPSGAGKTTLLRLIIRDAVPTKGKIFVDDWEVSKFPKSKIHELRRKVGTIFQDFKILPDRTVFENVALGLEILGKKDAEIAKDVAGVLALVELEEKSRRFPQELSSGELQRISIARAIAGGPKILLADEPTGNLDPVTSMEILDILGEVNKIGTTIVMATHNADIVNHFKKRTITMEDGAIISDEEKGQYRMKKKPKSKHTS